MRKVVFQPVLPDDGDAAEATYEVVTSSGTWDFRSAGSASTVDVLVVAGGDGGGAGFGGGGGGAGGVVVSVGGGGVGGARGAGGSNGGDPSFGGYRAVGGGGGGAHGTDADQHRGGDGANGLVVVRYSAEPSRSGAGHGNVATRIRSFGACGRPGPARRFGARASGQAGLA